MGARNVHAGDRPLATVLCERDLGGDSALAAGAVVLVHRVSRSGRGGFTACEIQAHLILRVLRAYSCGFVHVSPGLEQDPWAAKNPVLRVLLTMGRIPTLLWRISTLGPPPHVPLGCFPLWGDALPQYSE